MVVEFKRGVYQMALTELARYLPRSDLRNRFLRGGIRTKDGAFAGTSGDEFQAAAPLHMELPPGASFDPDPHTG